MLAFILIGFEYGKRVGAQRNEKYQRKIVDHQSEGFLTP
jgi:hypothetical protein